MDYEAEYNNRAKVPDFAAIAAGWAARCGRLPRAHQADAELGLRYGPGPRQTLDLFWPDAGQ